MCNITSGSDLICKYSVGGINRLWLMNKSEIDGYSIDGTTLGLTDLVMKATVNPLVFYTPFEFEFSDETGLATSELTVSNGQRYWSQTIGMSLPVQAQATINMINELGLSNLVAIIEAKSENTGPFSAENQYFIFGLRNGLKAATISSSFGQANGDYSGFVLTLTGFSTEQHKEILLDNGAYVAPTITAGVVTAGVYPSYAKFIDRLMDDTDL